MQQLRRSGSSHHLRSCQRVLCLLLLSLAISVTAQAQTTVPLYDNLTNLTVDQSPTYGGFINSTASTTNGAPASGTADAYYGPKPMEFAETYGSNTITNLRVDDTAFPLSSLLANDPDPGRDILQQVAITQVSFVVTNLNNVDVNARLRLRFYDDDGTAIDGQPSFPGTLLNQADYSTTLTLAGATAPPPGTALPGFSTQLVTVDLTNPVLVPLNRLVGASKRIWVGGVFDTQNGALSTGNSATDETLLSNIGFLYDNPTGLGFDNDHPILGTSGDVAAASGNVLFTPSTSPDGFYSNNPNVYPFDTSAEEPPINNLRADFAISFQGYGVFVAAPEPGSLLLLGTGLLSIGVVWRRKR